MPRSPLPSTRVPMPSPSSLRHPSLLTAMRRGGREAVVLAASLALSLLPACNDHCPEGTHLKDGRCVTAETHDCQLDDTCDAGQGGSTAPDSSMANQGGSGSPAFAEDCSGDTQHSDQENGERVACLDDRDCPDSVCDDGECVQCLEDTDCGEAEVPVRRDGVAGAQA